MPFSDACASCNLELKYVTKTGPEELHEVVPLTRSTRSTPGIWSQRPRPWRKSAGEQTIWTKPRTGYPGQFWVLNLLLGQIGITVQAQQIQLSLGIQKTCPVALTL